MNDLTVTTGRQVGASQPQAPSRAATVARALRDIRAELLKPLQDFRLLEAAYPDWWTSAYRLGRDYLNDRDLHTRRPDTAPSRDRALERAKQELAKLPVFRILSGEEFITAEGENTPAGETMAALAAAAAAKPDPKRTRVLVGLMIDAFPNARPHDPVTYTETLVHELLVAAIPPAAVAQACNEVIRTATFVPAVAELLVKADTAKSALECRSLLEHTESARSFLEDRIACLEALTDLPVEIPPPPARAPRTLNEAFS